MEYKEVNNFKKNLLSMGLMYAANYALPLLTMPYVARVLGPDKFGLVNYSQAYIQYFGLLVNFGFELTASRRIAAKRGDIVAIESIFNETIFTKVTLLIISFVLFLIITILVPSFWAERRLHSATFITCIAYCLYPTWLYQGMEDLTKTAVFNVIMKFFFTALIFLFVRTETDYVYHNLSISLGQVIIATIALSFALRKYNLQIKIPSIAKIIGVIKTYKLIFFSTIVVNLYTGTNSFILGLLTSARHVGYFSSAHKVVIIGCLFVTGAFGQAFYPYITREFASSRDNGLKIVKKILPKVALLTAFLSICIFFAANRIIILLYGESFKSAVLVLQILAFQPFIISISNILGVQTMLNLKLDKLFYRITLCGALLGTFLNFSLVPYYLEVGTAWAWVITELFIIAFMIYSLQERGFNFLPKIHFFTMKLAKKSI